MSVLQLIPSVLRWTLSPVSFVALSVQDRLIDVAVAAVAGPATIRLGVGGMAPQPVMRDFILGDDLRKAINALAWELEGYEDMHASSRMRRDLLLRVGPAVMEDALRCAV